MTTPPTASLGNGQLPPPGQVRLAQPAAAPAPAPAAAPMSATTPPPANAPAQHIAAHDTMLGRAFKILSGHTTQYHVDPTTGQTVATPVQNKPGQFFRNIVAGALLGGAAGGEAGAKDEGSPAGAVVAGGAAVINRNQMLDKERFQRAQQEYANELKTNQEQRAQKEFQNEQTLFKAQMANTNLEQYKLHLSLAGESWKLHQQEALAGKAMAQVYTDAGVTPTQTMPESEVQSFIEHHPGAATEYSFITTGTQVTGHDPKTGLPTYESTISLFPKDQNPNLKKYSVTPSLIKQLKTDHMDQYYPDLFNNLKPGTKISGSQFAAIRKFDTQLRTENLNQQKIQTGVQANEAKIAAYKAEAARAQELMHTDQAKALLGKNQTIAVGNALKDLSSGKEITPEDRAALGEYAVKMIPYLNDELKSEMAAHPDQQTPRMTNIMGQMDDLRKWLPTFPGGGGRGPQQKPNYFDPSTGQSYAIPQDKINDFLKQNPSAVPYVPPAATAQKQTITPQFFNNLLKLPMNMANQSIDNNPNLSNEEKNSLKVRLQRAHKAGIKQVEVPTPATTVQPTQ